MVKFLIKIVILFTIGWLIYAKFFGTAEEKNIARNITGSFVNLVSGITDAIKNEAQKGTFDKALVKTSEALRHLAEQDTKGTYKQRITELEAERKRIEQDMEAAKRLKSTADTVAKNEQLKKDFNRLSDEINKLSGEIEKNNK